ncbi:uncharacterized protein LOC128551703 [Mercenaria mercenaria]|uniref:uncharacterized protein LOC128551703 n=1 Tax=Mercenaria mercenaria TaxID=6596 RepID=UPI00234F62E6|nr:uncharacterized protein LOC128551703 [Mercenaria mercenaria]
MLMKIDHSKWIKAILLFMVLNSVVFIYIQSDSTLPWYHITKFIWLTPTMNKTCNGTLFPEIQNNESNWGPVDIEKTIFIISAYFVKSRNRVFVIGAKPFHRVSVICQLWQTTSDKQLQFMQQTEAEIVAPSGGNRYSYASTIFACQINATESPTHVSLVLNSCDNPLNMLRIREVSKPEKYERRFTVCTAPLFGFRDSLRLVEWIEFNRILGADKILLYNYSTSAKVHEIISHYLKSDLIDVIQWRFPFPSFDIEFFAQKAALNDCLFRNKNVSEFIVNIDTDEFIIPRSKGEVNWSQMLAQLDQNCVGYLIRHTFFRTDWKNENLNVTGIIQTLDLF